MLFRSVSQSRYGPAVCGEEGRKLATELATSAKNGYTMVVVAGMGYASYVNAKGLDVMDSAMIEIKELLKP